MDKMAMKDSTHTGCLEAGTAKGTFRLKLAAGDHMAMNKDAGHQDSMTHGATASTLVSLTSSSVDLSKHLGHKVSVTGSHDKATGPFSVKTLKMVAASCS